MRFIAVDILLFFSFMGVKPFFENLYGPNCPALPVVIAYILVFSSAFILLKKIFSEYYDE